MLKFEILANSGHELGNIARNTISKCGLFYLHFKILIFFVCPSSSSSSYSWRIRRVSCSL